MNFKRLNGKRILVTAAGQGMGRASCIAFAKEGAQVFATDINENALKTLAEEVPEIETFVLDVLDSNAIAHAPSITGKITTLFNCAGYVHHGTVLEMSDEDWDFSFNLNVRSQFQLIQAYLPGMREAKSGSIINMASVASSIKGTVNRCLYGSTKGAILGLTKAVAADYVAEGIRCNALCPGTILSPSMEERMYSTGNFEKAKSEFLARQPIGRFADPDEVTGILIHLASDESKFTTGTFQIVDGGWSL